MLNLLTRSNDIVNSKYYLIQIPGKFREQSRFSGLPFETGIGNPSGVLIEFFLVPIRDNNSYTVAAIFFQCWSTTD